MASTSSSALLAIDLGTSAIKVVAFDLAGQRLASRHAETPTTRLANGRAEHDVDLLWATAARLIKDVVTDVPRHRVEAVGLASVGETGVPLDAEGRPVRPAIAWFDSRGEAEAGWWTSQVGTERVGQISGQAIDSHYSVNRLLWLREHEPQSFARIRHWLSLADLIVHRLCGIYATDFTLASRMMVFDQRTLDWSDELLAVAGLERALFPGASPSGTPVGVVTQDAARLTGLARGTPVVAGGHDRLCAAYATRGSQPVPVDSTGSAEALVVPVAAYIERGPSDLGFAACYADVVPGQFVVSARVGYAGALIDWYHREMQLGEHEAEHLSVDTLVDWPLSFSGLLAYPSFGRVLGPEWDPVMTGGAIIGLTLGHRQSHIVQALVEGVTFALRANLAWLEQLLGHPIATFLVEGPMTGSRVWMQLKADVTGRRVEGVRLEEATALGAALLAGVGAGIYADHAAAAATVQRELTAWLPTADLAAIYSDVFERGFSRLAPSIRDIAAVVRRATPD